MTVSEQEIGPPTASDSLAWEQDLVRRMVSGDESAFDEFADEFLPRLYRFAVSKLRGQDPSGDLARDLVQTTLCKVIPKMSSFRHEARLFTWLCTCCRNEILMHFRKAERRSPHVDLDAFDETTEAVADGGPEQDFAVREKVHMVHAALDELPSNYAQALEWKYIDRLPVQEIANRLELGLKAAESLLTRARGAFRRSFAALQAVPLQATNTNLINKDATGLSALTDVRTRA